MDDPAASPDSAALARRMVNDAGAVIDRRLRIMTQAVCEPAHADLAELTLMSAEKIEAFTEAAGHAAEGAGIAAARIAENWVQEVQAASDVMNRMSAARDPAEAARLQMNGMMDWWTRAGAAALTFNAELARTQARMLAPIQAAVTANARRLRDQ